MCDFTVISLTRRVVSIGVKVGKSLDPLDLNFIYLKLSTWKINSVSYNFKPGNFPEPRVLEQN